MTLLAMPWLVPEPLASAPDDVVALAIGPGIDRYVAGDLDLPAGYRG